MGTGDQVVVMGVSGSGKSTVGVDLAERLGVPFEDGDDLHPQANKDKMARGEALDDDDRWPWLERVGRWLGEHADGGVVACSALKRDYRDVLRRHAPGVRFLLLHGDRETLLERVEDRSGHFMPASLLDSQLATLEVPGPDEDGVVVEVEQDVDQVVDAAVAGLAATTVEQPAG